MAWVKRNLVFVIIVAVGLIGTGYCGYLVYSATGTNAGISSDYATALEQLQKLQQEKPPATKDNIAAAKADQERVRTFLSDFRKSFAPFPKPPVVDERGFVEHLQLTVRRWALEATNAGVGLQPNYAFSFSQERGKMSFEGPCITGWMKEMEDIQIILHILFTAKINFLESVQRVQVCDGDNDGNDTLQTTVISNQVGIITPYKVTFRGFSTEVAAVLTAFADSTNCFIVKVVNVTPSHAALPQITEPTAAPPPQRFAAQEYNPYDGMEGGEGGGRGRYRRGQMMRQQEAVVIAQPTGPKPPETILQETPLYVTIVVDAVNLKTSEK